MNQTTSPTRRRVTLILMFLVFALAGVAAGLWYWTVGQWRETTDNAYVTGNLVVVSAQVEGTVVSISTEENDVVATGSELLRLGDGDALQELQLRQQELALAVQEVVALRAQVARARAELALREVTKRLAQEEFQRRENLHRRKMLSDEELDTARTRAEETAGELDTARQVLSETNIRAGTGAIETQPLVMAAAARLRPAFRAWQKTHIVAPVDGEVARRRVQLGQRVEAGTPLFSIAERHHAWVEANFKESQLRNVRPGQPVDIRSDLYGDEYRLSGEVESIGTGTGAVFSLLPAQNATGNWIKIVQRVPVRIALTQDHDPDYPLPFGASLNVSIDTHERSGPRVALQRPTAPVAQTDVFDYPTDAAERMIAVIIERTAGGAAP
ncbi:MAG: HlyD family efflux transporter periplasmic adaptor subunit [Gammaproteobacteria bacterium]|jgi:membrane fusion protein (multidrug efflux system)|nr:HlyD family efflux transporter periplasmic adaptor subunit [Gammaproteobacteria bacterium]MBK7521200.1 HlyD family efflux transporter periplasmic adaptor subunit [Gammaproteobacteria bacterium]MBK7728974.1 HlyD family efflux transporter periplasmic adaptor subunit [Gammaproteobacteria bacterium]MBP6228698.1 HlyD family efflux transporter periplasmic adaptor subunit [Pseudomonadales bacterium]